MNRSRLVYILLLSIVFPLGASAQVTLPGLEAPVEVVRDADGIPHIYAKNEHDLFFMQGRVHAQDRLFQMDLLRRSAAGTLAELVGTDALPTDIETRAMNFRRAAELSMQEHSPGMLAILEAYSAGVNSFIEEVEADPFNRLPPEYLGLMLFTVERWQPLDSILVGKALGAATSFSVTGDIDLTVALRTYQGIGDLAGFDGSRLFFDDLFRNAPFNPAATVPDAFDGFETLPARPKIAEKIEKLRSIARKHALQHGRDYSRRIRKMPKIPGALPLEGSDMGGSNSWVVSGRHTPSRSPILANDMHLRLESPPIFHEVNLVVPGMNVSGSSLPGAPCVVRGHNQSIAWGITNARLDITDVYAEVIVFGGPTGLQTLHNGETIPVVPRIETFRANVDGNIVPIDSATTTYFAIPRRDGGPLITPPVTEDGVTTAFSVQTTGFGPTQDPEGICGLNRARNLDQFKQALQLIDFASQNITYADKAGNIAYFVTGELPLREDLQNLTPAISPPFLVRNGSGGNDWIELAGDRPQNQASQYAILPFEEMPQVINPPSGVIVNANNDHSGNTLDNDVLNDPRAGGGLRYLNWGGRSFSIRAGRITELLREGLSAGKHGWLRKKLGVRKMQALQADIVMNDAKVFTPHLLDAWDNANASGAHPLLAGLASDPRLAEAVERLRLWDFRTPTGIPEGYDAKPRESDHEASVATTLYTVWRSKMVQNTIDNTLNFFASQSDELEPEDIPKPALREEAVTALKHLLERDGIGESGLNFTLFKTGITDPAVSLDVVILLSLQEALDLLKSDAFAAAFGNSANQGDYRWGRLHRIVFRHPLGDASGLNVPPGAGFFAPPLTGLDGIPTDGGYETVDEGSAIDANNVRVSDDDSMMFDVAPTGRFIARAGPRKVRAQTSLPGGNSAVPGSPLYLNLLEPYLENKAFRMRTNRKVIEWESLSIEKFIPAGS